MKVVTIDPAKEQEKKHRESLFEVLDAMREMIEEGRINEFVAASVSDKGEVQIHAGCKDLLGAVGLFCIGQKIMIDRQEQE